ncbi:copper transporter [Brachybacterium hainanense]|uniref:Copper transporter n=1 Tax=Brachybacterium hainanense TaxID=1541174 RepID=A0ABV6REL3_9MICO
MIDFRYHLVSLISVFIALAIGIVLGAGPLRDSLGDQLSDQVEQLRTEKEEMRTANDAMTVENDQLAGYIQASAPQLLDATLEGTTIALVTEEDSTRSQVDAVEADILAAGGQVGPRISLQSALWSPDGAEQRSDALAQLRGIDPALLAEGEDDIAVLGGTIAGLLSGDAEEDGPDAQTRAEAWEALRSSQLIALDGDPARIDAVAYLGAEPAALAVDTEDAETAGKRAQSLLTMQTSLLLGLVAADTPTVVSAVTTADTSSDGILSTVRTDSRFRSLSTTDRLTQADGPVLAVLALAEQLRGGVGDYGTASDADSRLPEVDRAAPLPGQSADAGGAGTAPEPSDGGEG